MKERKKAVRLINKLRAAGWTRKVYRGLYSTGALMTIENLMPGGKLHVSAFVLVTFYRDVSHRLRRRVSYDSGQYFLNEVRVPISSTLHRGYAGAKRTLEFIEGNSK
jgi:hypothetical protein